MRSINVILNRMKEYGDSAALYWRSREYTFADIISMMEDWESLLREKNIKKGTVCAILGDYSPQTCALIFALIQHAAIVVPFTREIVNEIPKYKEIACVECQFTFDDKDNWCFEEYVITSTNSLITEYRNKNTSGLIVFTSGSTGEPKGILQNCERVLDKFLLVRDSWRTVLFLTMDHFGGFNTLLSSFAYGGVGICLPDRKADTVCKIIEESHATLLPTTPTFLNILIASGCYRIYKLDSIKLITYGTEMMTGTTLNKLQELFPRAVLKQTYGLSELGVLRSKSENNNSTWMKIGGNEFKLRIEGDVLWIKADSNMVGYLNAKNPFDEEGWFCTGDKVEVKGEYIRFLGRISEIINVGGQKVYPAEVEAVLLKDNNVTEAAVYGKSHPLMGQVVMCKITIKNGEEPDCLRVRLRKLCLQELAKFKIPVRFDIVCEDEQHNSRYKKIRS